MHHSSEEPRLLLRGGTVSILRGLGDFAGPGSFATNPFLKSPRAHCIRRMPAEYARPHGPYQRSVAQMRVYALTPFLELSEGVVGLLTTAYSHLLLEGRLRKPFGFSNH